MEGALVLWMQRKFQTVPNPWRRTYQATILAPWESSMDFCSQLMRDIPRLNRAQVHLFNAAFMKLVLNQIRKFSDALGHCWSCRV